MLKKGVSILVLLSFLSFLLFSCTGDRATGPRNRSGACADLACLEDQLSRAPEVRELLEVRDEIAARAVARHITGQQLREAAHDARMANELLGLSVVDAQMLQERIDAAIASLYEKYPMIETLTMQRASECEACDINGIVRVWENYWKAFGAAEGVRGVGTTDRDLRAPAREPLTCKWVQLTIGFAICALKSGGSLLFYAVCAYGVFCGSCDGSVVDALCG